jgi:hypothetical protein
VESREGALTDNFGAALADIVRVAVVTDLKRT